MSYCGTCGKFFTPDCPHSKNGGICVPAMNPYDHAIALFNAKQLAIHIELESMKAAGNYTEDSFLSVHKRLEDETKAFAALV